MKEIQKWHCRQDNKDWGRINLFSYYLLMLCHMHLCSSHPWCYPMWLHSHIPHLPMLSMPSHAQNGRRLTPSAVGGRHANILERNGRHIPGPSVPVHTDMYTWEVHRHACVLTGTVRMDTNTRSQTNTHSQPQYEERHWLLLQTLLTAKRRGLPFPINQHFVSLALFLSRYTLQRIQNSQRAGGY